MSQKTTKYLQHRFIQTFGIIVLVLALVRCVFPGDSKENHATTERASDNSGTSNQFVMYSNADMTADGDKSDLEEESYVADTDSLVAFDGNNYSEAFNDSNHVQLVAANKWGVTPVQNRKDAEARKDEVVYVGMSPFYDMAYLDASIPYLVPRAYVLLQDISVNFMDSLRSKGMPLHRVMVSSVLRSQDDVARLRRTNKNAAEQSCHLWGTTFDINYSVFLPVGYRALPAERLKKVLGQVLSDLHLQGRCYVKHEVKQPCFHITVR